MTENNKIPQSAIKPSFLWNQTTGVKMDIMPGLKDNITGQMFENMMENTHLIIFLNQSVSLFSGFKW